MIITITQCVHAIFNLSMHIMLNKINDSIIAKLPIFSHTVLKGLEHSSGMKCTLSIVNLDTFPSS